MRENRERCENHLRARHCEAFGMRKTTERKGLFREGSIHHASVRRPASTFHTTRSARVSSRPLARVKEVERS